MVLIDFERAGARSGRKFHGGSRLVINSLLLINCTMNPTSLEESRDVNASHSRDIREVSITIYGKGRLLVYKSGKPSGCD